MPFILKSSYEGNTRRWTQQSDVFPTYQSLSDQIHRIFGGVENFYLTRVTFSPSAGDQQPTPSQFVLIANTVNSADEWITTAAAPFLGVSYPTGMLKFIVNDKLPYKEAPIRGGPWANSMDVDVEPRFPAPPLPFPRPLPRGFSVPMPPPLPSMPSRMQPPQSIPSGLWPLPSTRGSSLPIPAPCPSAAFVADITIPDGHILPPGAFFVKSWKMLNDGEIPWPAGTHLAFTSGERFGTSSANAEQMLVAVAGLTPPGEMTEIRVGFRAPGVPGKYISYWRLQDEEGRSFGHRIWCEVEVVEPQPRAEDASLKTKSSVTSAKSEVKGMMEIFLKDFQKTLADTESGGDATNTPSPISKPVALGPTPLPTHDALCAVCRETIIGSRHRCLDCPDYDLCDRCIASRRDEHDADHQFCELKEPGKIIVHNSNRPFPNPGHHRGPSRRGRHSGGLATSSPTPPNPPPPFWSMTGSFPEDFQSLKPLAGTESGGDAMNTPSPISKPVAPGPTTSLPTHDALCDVCREAIIGSRHKCLDCPNYDMCDKCIVSRRDGHDAEHEFYEFKEPGKIIVHNIIRLFPGPRHHRGPSSRGRHFGGLATRSSTPPSPPPHWSMG